MLNNQQAIQRVQQTFLHPYNDDNYSIFITDLLKNLKTNDNFEKQIENDDHIESYKRIGCYEDNNGDIVDILSVKVKHGAILERTRTRLRDFTVDHIRNSPTDPDGCLVAFYADEFNDWRFSFVKMSYKVVEDVKTGKIKTKEEISEPKRYSFLIGSDEPSFTAQKQMIPLLQSSNIAFNDIVDAFSTERVTNEFYQAYRALFEDLTLSLVQIRENDPKIKENFEKEFIKEDDFAKKLLGQIVFIYFIQRKGWLGIKKDNNGNFGKWGSGDKKFIRNLFNKKYCQYNNFFNDVLEHLFYNGLGTENSDNYFSLLDCKIPFLNGGIFEPLNNYNWQETDIVIEDKTIKEILDVFDRFNFTVREESELDVDVAVDPEMLGRVFENLLPENIRKGKGAYYTPRTIVNYMCQESIINYLDSKTAEFIGFDTIEDFIKRNNVEKLSKYNAELLDSLLKDIKICDPAIGSGAFPMGLLNQIVKSRSLLCSLIEKKIDKYELKRYAIINSIYGVDLDPGAVEIAKLRLFLSLIVDEKDYDSIEPLPNLDFQIMQGNSLIEEFYGITLDISKKTVQGEIFEDVNKIDVLISNLHQAQSIFSNESNYKKKKELKNKVENCIIDIFKFKYKEKKNISEIDSDQMNKDIDKIVHAKKPRNFFPWKLYFADIFRSNGGFDIVIGNPPYISFYSNTGSTLSAEERSYFFKNYSSVLKINDRINSMNLFTELSLNILKNNGYNSFIVNKTMAVLPSYSNFRKYFLSKGKFDYILTNLSPFNAIVDCFIYGFNFLDKEDFSDYNLRLIEDNLIDQKIINSKIFLENNYNEFSVSEYHSLLEKILNSSNLKFEQVITINRGINIGGKFKNGDFVKDLFLSNTSKEGYLPYIPGTKNIKSYCYHIDNDDQLFLKFDQKLEKKLRNQGFTLALGDKNRYLKNNLIIPESGQKLMAAFTKGDIFTSYGLMIGTNINDFNIYYLCALLN